MRARTDPSQTRPDDRRGNGGRTEAVLCTRGRANGHVDLAQRRVQEATNGLGSILLLAISKCFFVRLSGRTLLLLGLGQPHPIIVHVRRRHLTYFVGRPTIGDGARSRVSLFFYVCLRAVLHVLLQKTHDVSSAVEKRRAIALSGPSLCHALLSHAWWAWGIGGSRGSGQADEDRRRIAISPLLSPGPAFNSSRPPAITMICLRFHQ
ncbi:uncharacterized protein BKA78DRAFT_140483 [Phyllosticta capitalensis]|uniref:uncharacterized protein n=1 Tax=Phyllosticta capitalensis TaxID=121624 RepID=UPI00312F98CA